MKYLIGDKIKLCKFSERFITPSYIDWLNDPEVNRFLYIGRMPVTAKELNDPNTDKNILFAIMANLYLDDTGNMAKDEGFIHYIGTISLNSIDWINRKGEIGYMIGSKAHWGCGIATEAVRLVSDYALNRLNLHKVEAGVIEGNTGSIKVLEKCGFKQHAMVPQDYFLEGKYFDAHRFHKLQGW